MIVFLEQRDGDCLLQLIGLVGVPASGHRSGEETTGTVGAGVVVGVLDGGALLDQGLYDIRRGERPLIRVVR